MTWNEICRVILPHLVSSCWENEMKESMENYICDKYPNFSKININDYSFQIIKIQLMALGLMTMVSSTKSKSNLALWTLTKYGHNMLLRLNALRRYEEITR